MQNLSNYYHKNHGIMDSFHDHDHDHDHNHILVLIHVQEIGTILHSLQEMVQIQLDESGDFLSKAPYFVQQQEDMILI